jgi:hypothetical protein
MMAIGISRRAVLLPDVTAVLRTRGAAYSTVFPALHRHIATGRAKI